jgi:hypothetical protein
MSRPAQVPPNRADVMAVLIVVVALAAWCAGSLPLGIVVGKLFARQTPLPRA